MLAHADPAGGVQVEADPLAALARPIGFSALRTAAFRDVDREVARHLGDHELLPVDLTRYRLAGNAHWTCASLAYFLSGGLDEPSDAAVTAATAVTLLRIILEQHGGVPRQPPAGSGVGEKNRHDRMLLLGDLAMARIAYLASTVGRVLGDVLIAEFVGVTASSIVDRAGPYLTPPAVTDAGSGSLVDRPLVRAALSISGACRR